MFDFDSFITNSTLLLPSITIGRLLKVCGQIGTRSRASSLGCMMGPPQLMNTPWTRWVWLQSCHRPSDYEHSYRPHKSQIQLIYQYYLLDDNFIKCRVLGNGLIFTVQLTMKLKADIFCIFSFKNFCQHGFNRVCRDIGQEP